MTYAFVDLGKNIEPMRFEEALHSAAKELGLTAKIQHELDNSYRLTEHAVHMSRNYSKSEATIRGIFREIHIQFDATRPVKNCSVFYGYPFWGGKDMVEHYLEALQKNIQPLEK